MLLYIYINEKETKKRTDAKTTGVRPYKDNSTHKAKR